MAKSKAEEAAGLVGSIDDVTPIPDFFQQLRVAEVLALVSIAESLEVFAKDFETDETTTLAEELL